MFIIHPNIKKQAGVSVVTAIFLVVILALMGVGMVSLISTSQQSISQEFTSAKAYMAGRSCLQWGMYQAVYTAAPSNNTTTFNNANSGLVSTRCTTAIDTVSNDGLTFFNITATASIGGVQDPEYSRRQLQIQFQP
jgi:MSHA biogenesis protein MshP